MNTNNEEEDGTRKLINDIAASIIDKSALRPGRSDELGNEEQINAENEKLKLENARLKLQNEDLKQDICLKKDIKNNLFTMLAFELAFIIVIVILSGFSQFTHFHLDKWVLGVFINGIVIQTFFSIRTVVSYLYPKKSEEK